MPTSYDNFRLEEKIVLCSCYAILWSQDLIGPFWNSARDPMRASQDSQAAKGYARAENVAREQRPDDDGGRGDQR
jgi:hypothetical protein